MNIDQIIESLNTKVVEYTPKLLLAVVTLVVGLFIIKRIVKVSTKLLGKNGIDTTLAKFLSSLIDVALKVMLLFSIAGMFGINTTSFIAIISALMVGIGMALNGTLSHIASGVMLMIFKPFKVGDIVEVGGGRLGQVQAINAFSTTLLTLDNKKIIVANSNVTGNDIVNISGQETIGVELTFGIAYNADIDKAKEIILNVGRSCPHILEHPEQGVVVSSLGDSSVNLSTRPFCKSENYWDTLFYMNENVKKALDQNNIGIPYPTMDVNLTKS